MPYLTKAKSVSLGLLARWFGMAPEESRKLALRHFDGYRIAFRPKTSDEEVLAQGFARDVFSRLPEFKPKKTDVVLDVGAHLGALSLLAAPRVRQVYALEPRGDTYALLRLNVFVNRARNVAAERLALSDKDGSCKLFYAPDGESWGDSIVFDHARASEDVPCISLSRFFAERKIAKVDFAKFNCEGAEFPILLSSDRRTLSVMEKMLILYHCDLVPNASEKSLESHLEACGFRTAIRNRSKDRGWLLAQRA